MSDVTFFELADYAVTKLLRRISAIAIVVVIALAAHHQIISTLLTCLRMWSSDPFVCSVPEVTLPHTDTEGRDTPGQVPRTWLFITKITSTASVTPCSDAPKQSSAR